MSSLQIRAFQSPTLRKFLGKNGFLCREYTGPRWPGYMATIFSAGVLAFLLHAITVPCSEPTMNFVGCIRKVRFVIYTKECLSRKTTPIINLLKF